MIHCRCCGSVISEESEFCEFCGMRVNPAGTAAVKKAEPVKASEEKIAAAAAAEEPAPQEHQAGSDVQPAAEVQGEQTVPESTEEPKAEAPETEAPKAEPPKKEEKAKVPMKNRLEAFRRRHHITRKAMHIAYAVLAALCAAVVLVVLLVVVPQTKYAEASALMEAGSYEAARQQFAALGNYSDSAEKAQYCADILQSAENEAAYAAAQALMDAGDLTAAAEAFRALGDYSDAAQKAEECGAAVLLAEHQKAYAEAESS